MKIYEYQAKEILKNGGIPVPEGYVVPGTDLGVIPFKECVVKAQVHVGGRGKGGGIIVAKNREEIKEGASRLLGTRLVTPQTTSEGVAVKSVLLEEIVDISKEYYIGITIDRAVSAPVLIISSAGGKDVESAAIEDEAKFVREIISGDFSDFKLRRAAFKVNLPTAQLRKELISILERLVEIFYKYDISLIEINPLVLTAGARLIACDAKIIFDDNALPKHPELKKLYDPESEDEKEAAAYDMGISYVKLNGTVGCMVNGAGLAMATMDIIKFYGAEPANFLDVGGGASRGKVKDAFKLLVTDEHVKVILVNIFGGILRCDILAEGMLDAFKDTGTNLPVVVRMKGTNHEEGKKILTESGYRFHFADRMDEAARLSVKLSGEK